MTVDVSRLPRRELVTGTQLYRIHLAEHGPWYFSADGRGRFDPTEVHARGSSYRVEAPLGAWVEVFRTVMTIVETPAQVLIGIALFGPRGVHPLGLFGPTVTAPVGRDLIRAAEDTFGYRVVPVP